jgi:hypothetical protein
MSETQRKPRDRTRERERRTRARNSVCPSCLRLIGVIRSFESQRGSLYPRYWKLSRHNVEPIDGAPLCQNSGVQVPENLVFDNN